MLRQIESLAQCAPFVQHGGDFVDDRRSLHHILIFGREHARQQLNIRLWYYAVLTFVSVVGLFVVVSVVSESKIN